MADQRRKGCIGAPSFSSASRRPAGPVKSTLRMRREPLRVAPGWAGAIVALIPLSILRAAAANRIWRRVTSSGHLRFEALRSAMKRNGRLRYSGSIMKDHFPVALIDPIGLTRQLCEIESTTYHEGAVGDFLARFSCRAAAGRWRRRQYRSRPRARPAPRAGMFTQG